MNVLEALIGVIPKQLAITLMEATAALATLDTQAVGVLAQVGAGIHNRCTILNIVLSTSNNEVAIITAMLHKLHKFLQ